MSDEGNEVLNRYQNVYEHDGLNIKLLLNS